MRGHVCDEGKNERDGKYCLDLHVDYNIVIFSPFFKEFYLITVVLWVVSHFSGACIVSILVPREKMATI